MRFKEILSHTFRHINTIIFIWGFVFDIFILPDIKGIEAKLIGLLYIVMVALFIYFREWIISRNTASSMEGKLFTLCSFVISFFSGSALSFVFVYSMRSAEITSSWPILFMLLLTMVINEFVSTHNFRFALDIGILFTATLFYIIFHMPEILHKQNDNVFLISIFITAIISLFYGQILRKLSHTANAEAPKTFALAIGIPMIVTMFYFLNAIPAVPLSIDKIGIYHNLIKEGNNYKMAEETQSGWLSKIKTEDFHFTTNDKAIYFYSSIDTPAEITAPISHVWEYYDNEKEKWIEKTTISFNIVSVRGGGYKTYSEKENITEGLWRVTVKVGSNRVIGRKKFNIIKSNDELKLNEVNF